MLQSVLAATYLHILNNITLETRSLDKEKQWEKRKRETMERVERRSSQAMAHRTEELDQNLSVSMSRNTVNKEDRIT